MSFSENKDILLLLLFVFFSGSNQVIRVRLDPVTQPGHWPRLVTRLATVECMREWFKHACNSNRLIILASKEGNLLGHAAAGGEVEGDSRMTLETGGWENIATFP